MKKTVLKVAIVIIAIIFILLVKGIIVKALKSTEAANRIKTLPSFSLTTLEGGVFNSDDLTGGPLLIIYFHPECEHCQYEISALLESDLFSKGIKVLLSSNASPESISLFMHQFRTDDKDIQVLCDKALTFRELFGINVTPSNLIYNKDLKLVKFLKGEMKTELIINYLDSGN